MFRIALQDEVVIFVDGKANISVLHVTDLVKELLIERKGAGKVRKYRNLGGGGEEGRRVDKNKKVDDVEEFRDLSDKIIIRMFRTFHRG